MSHSQEISASLKAALKLASAMYVVGYDCGYEDSKTPFRTRQRRPVKGNLKALDRAVRDVAKASGITEQDVREAMT